MTKIPILLSILSLAGNSSAVPAMIDSISEPADIGAEVLGLNDVAEGNKATNVITNQGVPGLKFDELELGMGQLSWNFEGPDSEGRTFSRYIMAGLNYQNGATEAEADAALTNLGGSSDGIWTSWKTDFKARENKYVDGKKLFATIAWGNPFELNMPDLIYYAFEFRNWNDSTVEPVWYRGKIDYRSCVHDPGIRAVYGNTCTFSFDAGANRYNITPNGGTLSYEEELIELGREQYLDRVRSEIEELEKRKQDGDEGYRDYIDDANSALTEAKKWIEQIHATEGLAGEITDLEQRIEKLRQTETVPPTTGDNDENGGGDDNKNDGDDNTGNAGGAGSAGGADAGSGKIENNLGELNRGGSEVVGKIASTASTGKKVVFHLGNGKTESTESSAKEGSPETIGDIDDRSGTDSNQSGEVELPKLGNEEPWLKRNLWVLLLPVVAIGFLILILVKRRRDDEEE